MDNTDEVYQNLIEHLYHDTTLNMDYSFEQVKLLNKNAISPLYGELLYESTIKLLQTLKFIDKDIFVDLGSGVGKLVLTLYLRSNLKKVIGVEGAAELHLKAVSRLEKFHKIIPSLHNNSREIVFKNENFLTCDLSEPTIAYICILDQSILYPLGQRLNSAENFHTVISIAPISSLVRLKFKQTITLQCSWDTVQGYVYSSR